MSFRLFETMRVEPDGSIVLLDRHIRRLSHSAQHFAFTFDLDRVREAVLRRALSIEKTSWLRLTLHIDGEYSIESAPLERQNPRYLRLASFRVNSENPFLYHKTTNREIYDSAKQEGDSETEVLLANERGEITEVTIANVAVLRNGQWVTPLVSCGLLNGVMRSELLETGAIVEGVIRTGDLAPGGTVRCFNALRGVFDLEFVQTHH